MTRGMLSRKHWWILIGAVCAILVVLTGFEASAGEVADVDVKIERLALFKNGLGYFSSTAILPEAAKTVRIGQLPVPSHGTFWVGYPESVKVRALVTSMEDVEESATVNSVAELLRANTGREVVISTGSKDEPTLTGTIIDVKPAELPADPPSPYRMDIRRPSNTSRYQPYAATSLLLIRTKAGLVALNIGSISRADFESDDITTSVPVVSKRPSIRLEMEQAAGGERIGVSYLARGITWSPSYSIDLSDSAIARLSAKAVVINEAADLRGVHLDLVTGFPNIRFGDVNSPVAMSQDLQGFLMALTAGRSESSGLGGMMMQQAALVNVPRFDASMSVPMPAYSTAQQGKVSEDLFLYPVERFTLLRGETACLPLFTAEVPYKHLYIWKIPDMLDANERYRQGRDADEEELAQEVWHSCRLTNNMEMPWTTAAAEFVKDGQFTGQDICYYTAPGAETTIRINRAMNVLAQETELELARERNAATFRGYSYDLITVKGELKLQNRLDKRATVEVTKNLSGEVLESIPQAKDIPTVKGLKRVNPRHMLIWQIDLEPGQEQTLSYRYEVYIRS